MQGEGNFQKTLITGVRELRGDGTFMKNRMPQEKKIKKFLEIKSPVEEQKENAEEISQKESKKTYR